MIIKHELDLATFEAWSGARNTLDRLIETDTCKAFEEILEELYPDGLTETELNDILWFEDEWIFETLGIEEE